MTMETSHQVVILLALAASQAIAMALPYWMGRQAGVRLGKTAGIETACAELLPGIERAERELTATRAELRHVGEQLRRERRLHAEALALAAMQREVDHA